METTPSFFTVFKQSLMEGEKGSAKRFTAYITMLIVCFLCVYAKITGKEIEIGIILELLGFICVLFGISMYQSVATTKSDNQAKVDKAQ